MREKSYLELTEYNLKDCRKVTDDSLTFKEIARNLACIADELQEQNGWLGDIYEEVYSINMNTAEMCGAEDSFETEVNGKEECFICGAKVDIKDCRGIIIDSHGNFTCACEKCGSKFDAIIGGILGRPVHC